MPIQVEAVGGKAAGRQREQKLADRQHKALPQMQLPGGEGRRMQPRLLPLRPGAAFASAAALLVLPRNNRPVHALIISHVIDCWPL